MTTAESYRNLAARQRSLAANACLPLVRTQLLTAAERLEWLADEFEAMQAGVQAMFETPRRATH